MSASELIRTDPTDPVATKIGSSWWKARFDPSKEDWRKRGPLLSLYDVAEVAAENAAELKAAHRSGVLRRRWLTVEVQARDTWVTHSAVLNFHAGGKITRKMHGDWLKETEKLALARKLLEDSRRRSGLRKSRRLNETERLARAEKQLKAAELSRRARPRRVAKRIAPPNR